MDSKVSEKDMREVYFQAFGKEYDSADRKQAPLPLEIAYLVALKKLKREGKYAGGGEITNDTYYESVNHFIYFCMNYPRNFLDAFGSLKNHLSNKFKDYYNKYGTYGVMIQFYAELDAENRRILTDYSLKNYKGTPVSSDISEVEYFNSVNHFIFFCFNFPSNFMDAFSSHLKVHLSSKWTNAYEKKGSVGAMIYFWSELDNENRKKLANWVKANYTGTKLYEVGGALGDVAGMLPSPLPMSTIQAMEKGGSISKKVKYTNKTDGRGIAYSNFGDGNFVNVIELRKPYNEEFNYGVYDSYDGQKINLFKTIEEADVFYNQVIRNREKNSNVISSEKRYSDGGQLELFANGGGVKSDYYIFYGVDNVNGNSLYRVESSSESDNEYVGEWHTDINDAEKELNSLSKKPTQSLGVVKVIFENPEYNYTTNVGVNVTEEEARKYFVGQMFNVGVYPKENMQKAIDIEFSKSKEKYADGGEMDNVSTSKSNAVDKIDFEYYAKQHAGDYWNKMSSSEKSELMNDIRENWFNDSEYEKGGEAMPIYTYGIIDGEKFEVIGVNKKQGIVKVKNFSKFGTRDMPIKEWIPYTFEVGTPAKFIYNEREVSGEVVSRGGEKAISLYKDDNYGGDSERIIPFSKIDLTTLRPFSEKETFSLGGFLLGAGVGVLGSYLYNNATVEKDKKGVKIEVKKPKKIFKYGGEIEQRVKDKLSKNFALPFEIVVYVPSTQDADKIISKEEFNNRIVEVETYLAKLFGGFSANPVDGGYNSEDKGLITEDVFKVFSFASRDGFEPKMEELVIQIKKWCKVWGQEAIGLEFEGDLFYVEA